MKVAFNTINQTFGKKALTKPLSKKDKQYLLHEKYAKLAQDCGIDNDTLTIKGFDRICDVKNDNTGFRSSIYADNENKEVVIAYRYTDNAEGIVSDMQMIKGELPTQYGDAILLYELVKGEFPDFNVKIVGHSLGGSLAQLVASTDSDAHAVCFDPYGTKQIIKNTGLHDNKNCINYTTKGSLISRMTPHPGKTMTVKDGLSFEIPGTVAPLNFDKVAKKHSLSNYKNLRETKFANEGYQNIVRTINNKLIMSNVGRFLRKSPKLEEKVPRYFYNNGEGKLDKMNLDTVA